nr:MAG TPA: hypothetical protein [Caudoviricetes sp.]
MLILCSKFGKTKTSPYICHIEIRNQLNNKRYEKESEQYVPCVRLQW